MKWATDAVFEKLTELLESGEVERLDDLLEGPLELLDTERDDFLVFLRQVEAAVAAIAFLVNAFFFLLIGAMVSKL